MHPRLAAPILAAALAALAPAARADAPAAPQRGVMTATRIEGDVKATPRGGAAAPVAVGALLHEGDLIETGADARAEIALASGTLIRLGESSRAELREAPPEGGRFRLKLVAGNFWAKVSKLFGPDKFEVETENGVAGVRGTEFRMETGLASGHDLLRVYEGKVQCDHPEGKWSKLMEPGREFRFHRTLKGEEGAFDPAAEGSHKFMKWVRAHGLKAGALERRRERLEKRSGDKDDDDDDGKDERREERKERKKAKVKRLQR